MVKPLCLNAENRYSIYKYALYPSKISKSSFLYIFMHILNFPSEKKSKFVYFCSRPERIFFHAAPFLLPVHMDFIRVLFL